MIDLERLLALGCSETPVCRCGQEMHIDRTLAVREKTDAHIRVYRCTGCGHEMRLTIWAATEATGDALVRNESAKPIEHRVRAIPSREHSRLFARHNQAFHQSGHSKMTEKCSAHVILLAGGESSFGY
jgi:hypothetical protein